MVRWHRIFCLASLAMLFPLAAARACGPSLYENAELDRFSFLEPAILNTTEWTSFLAFASPALGQPSARDPGATVQTVIRPHRISAPALQGVSNLLYGTGPGEDPVLVATNEAWWRDYFRAERKHALSEDEVHELINGPHRPKWLSSAEKLYFALLDGEADDMKRYDEAVTQARNPRNPLGLRHRFAFWAVRALAVSGDETALTLFREFCPGKALDLPLARAQSWAARVVADRDPKAARDLWVDLFVRFPALRVSLFASLSSLPPEAWSGSLSAGALVARYFLDGRDFSPETLSSLAHAEKESGGDGTWTEAIFYSMAEQIEGEAGVFALFGLVDPQEVSPAGLYTSLIEQARELAQSGVQKPTRTWWLIAAYLALFDGDPSKARQLWERAAAIKATNDQQDRQTQWIETLITMASQKGQDWTAEVQQGVVEALDWGRGLDSSGHNRGLFHSVAVLTAQKYLARGFLPEATLAFGLLNAGPSRHLYSVRSDDDFWAYGWNPNNPIHLLMDALFTDDEIDRWKSLLVTPGPSVLTRALASRSFLSNRDLSWWQVHRSLRRGDGRQALALLKNLGPAADASVFPDRQFSYSLDLDPLHPREGRGMRTVSPATLAAVMVRVEDEAKLHPTGRTLLTQGEFWLSLQLSGLPLLFAQPPTVISFVNGNFEYYGYDGRDAQRSTAVVGTFPLGRPAQTDRWATRLASFYQTDFSTLTRVKAAFEAVLARHDDPEAEFRSLLFLQALDGQRMRALADSRYDPVALAQTFRNTCGLFYESWL